MTLRVGYFGLDHHHCPMYLETLATFDAEVAAAYESNEAVAPADVGLDVPVYRDPAALLDDVDVDLAWLTLSNRDSPDVVAAAVERGVDVYTEKPAARTAADLEPVAEDVRDAGATVAFSYTWRGHPLARELRARADEGFFGDVRSFDLRFVAQGLDARDTDHYLFDPAASRGGIVQWLGVHWIDLLAHVLSDPIVRVNASTSHAGGAGVEDDATLQLETASGALGTLHCGYRLPEGRYDTRIDVYGSDGIAGWDPMGERFGFEGETELLLEATGGQWPSTPRRRLVYEYEPGDGYGGSWGREFVRESLEACRTGADPPAGVDDALQVLRVLDAAYASAERDEWVDVESA